jgi:hypothetical protein
VIKKEPEVEWEFLSEEDQNAPWPPALQNMADHSERNRRPRIRRVILFSITMVVLLVVAIGGAYARQEALKGVETVEQEVQVAVEAEQWVQYNAPQLPVDVLVDDDASPYVEWMVEHEQALISANTNDGAPEPVLHIQDTWFADGIAAAKLTLTEPAAEGGAPAVFRQTRFYRETERGWLRTKPDPALWGVPLTLETDHLIWRYRRRDEAAVAPIAEQFDALYAQLQRDYGLAQSSEDDKQAIHVQVDYFPGLVTAYQFSDDPIVVPSPAVYLVPMERAEADILGQTVALSLLKSMWAQAVAQHGIEPSWTFLAGMSLWQMWEMGLGLSEWRDDVVQWVYGDVASDAGDSEVRLPARYRELCAAYGIWMIKPVSIGIPLQCDSRDGSPLHDLMLISLRHENLGSFQYISSYPRVEQAVRMERPLQGSTVVDYAVTTYGRERLPDLVAALGQHDSWETLAPAVYGVSLDEFEEGWRHHLAELAQ